MRNIEQNESTTCFSIVDVGVLASMYLLALILNFVLMPADCDLTEPTKCPPATLGLWLVTNWTAGFLAVVELLVPDSGSCEH